MATVHDASAQPAITISKRTGRRIGYVISILINLAFLAIINLWPGWQAMSFVTADAADVIPLVNASMIVTLLATLVYLVEDRARVKAIGEVVTGIVSIAAISAMLTVYPFDFSAYAFPWDTLTRIVLWIALIGSVISVLVNVVKAIAGPRRRVGT